MNRKTFGRVRLTPTSMVFLAVMLLALLPFFLLFMNSFKSMEEIAQNILGWPQSLKLENYRNAWQQLDYFRSFTNTLLVTLIGDAGLILFSSMAGYLLSRKQYLAHKVIYGILLASMAIPFESIMIPLMKITNIVGLSKSLAGLGVSYWGLNASTCIFLTYGTVKTIPYEIEEAATIDGCGAFRTFWKIIFPLLSPIVVTFTIINTFGIWNDYLMPQLMLGGNQKIYTIQLAMHSLFLEYFTMWDIALPALVLSILPIIIFFLFVQKKIISGITSGAVKG